MDLTCIKQTLTQDGIVIIPNLLDELECKNMYNGMWDCFEHLTQEWEIPIERSNPSTWKEFKHLKPNNWMMYQCWGISHAQHLWDIRSNKKIVNIWAGLLGTEPSNLLVSYDGISWLPPHEDIFDQVLPEFKPWFHLDQTVLKPYFDGMQGLVTGLDVNPDDATFVYYPNSHNMIKELVNKFGVRTKSDWYLLTDEENDFYRSICGDPVKLICPAGSLVIWDSRLVHCNTGPRKYRLKPNYRCVQYLSYALKPNNLDIIKERVEGFYSMKTSNHYASRATFFLDIPNVYKSKGYRLDDLITPLPIPVLTDLGKSLVGMESSE
jgi:hypothetical protein